MSMWDTMAVLLGVGTLAQLGTMYVSKPVNLYAGLAVVSAAGATAQLAALVLMGKDHDATLQGYVAFNFVFAFACLGVYMITRS